MSKQIGPFCPNCSSKLPTNYVRYEGFSAFCPYCGKSYTVTKEMMVRPEQELELTPTKSSLISINTIAIALIFLLIGVGIGYGVANVSEPIITTETITKTFTQSVMTSTTTLTKTIESTQQVTDLNKYASSMSDILQTFSNTAFEISDRSGAFSKGEISKNQYLSSIQSAKYETEQLVEKVIKQQPPEKLIEAHVHLVKSLNLAYSAYILIEDGTIHNDTSLIEEAIILMELSRDEMEFATKLIELAK